MENWDNSGDNNDSDVRVEQQLRIKIGINYYFLIGFTIIFINNYYQWFCLNMNEFFFTTILYFVFR